MAVERAPGGTSLIDVLDRILDKGIVVDAWVRISLVGIDLITVEARVVIASIDTYLSTPRPSVSPRPSRVPPSPRGERAAAQSARRRRQAARRRNECRVESAECRVEALSPRHSALGTRHYLR